MDMDKPIPETKTAVLWSDGVNQPTLHTFVESRELDDGSGWELIWECSVSGKQRRWGYVSPPEVN